MFLYLENLMKLQYMTSSQHTRAKSSFDFLGYGNQHQNAAVAQQIRKEKSTLVHL